MRLDFVKKVNANIIFVKNSIENENDNCITLMAVATGTGTFADPYQAITK